MTWERGLRPLAAVLAVGATLLLLAGCGGSDSVVSSGTGRSSVSDSLTGEFETISGETVDLATFAGSDVVLWFWAPW